MSDGYRAARGRIARAAQLINSGEAPANLILEDEYAGDLAVLATPTMGAATRDLLAPSLPPPVLQRLEALHPGLRARALDPGEGVELVRADALTVEPIAWKWPGYLAGGKLHIVAGAPGTTKTTCTLAFGATISQAGRWPDGQRAELGSVLLWSGEDGIEDTLLPRLLAHGADLTRVQFVRGTRSDEGRRAFDPASDMAGLALAASRIPDLALVVVDPIVLAVRGDSNTNGDVRRGLMPLVELAERTGAAAIGVTHFSKGTTGRNPVERVTGSLAFGAAARIVLVAAKLPAEQGGGRALLRAKSNLGPDGGGFRFDVRTADAHGAETIRLEWGQAISGDAHDILATAERTEDPHERAERDDAAHFLHEVLEEAGGSMDRREILVAAKRAGYSERSVERARGRLHIRTRTVGFGANRRASWYLADDHSITVTEPPTKNNGGIDGNGSYVGEER